MALLLLPKFFEDLQKKVDLTLRGRLQLVIVDRPLIALGYLCEVLDGLFPPLVFFLDDGEDFFGGGDASDS